jgi:hypothetical protein
MRIWSIHPEYLDTTGLVALWRETLLAKHVLEGKTRGYRNHPQLDRFKKTDNPVNVINYYLAIVYEEANKRGFQFDRDKIDWNFYQVQIPVAKGQMEFETIHLLNKLKIRDKAMYDLIRKEIPLPPHPLFYIVDGPIEPWEVL